MKKALKVLAIIILTVLILVGVLIWGIQTPFGQNFLTSQANSFLRKKLKTKVNIEKVRFDIPDWVLLEGVYFEDLHGDTLVAGKRLYVDLDMYSLIKGDIGINKVELEDVSANINRVLPDTTFNFQFIVDAFAGDTTVVDTTPSKPLNMRLDQISLKKVRFSYRDAVIGTDASGNIDSAVVKFDKFNPTISQYHLTTTALHNSQVKLRMYPALEVAAAGPDPKPDPADTLDVKVGDIDIQQFKWQFDDEVSGLKNGVTVDKMAGHVNNISMARQRVDVRNVSLQNMSLFAEFAKKPKTKAEKKDSINTSAPPAATPGWYVKVGEIKLEDNTIRYDDFNSPAVPKGLDYAHLNIKDLNVDLRDFLFSPENIAGALKSASFKDKSGFRLDALRTDFAYGEQETYLRNLYLKTPNTLLRDELSLRYKNLDQLTNDIGKVKLKLRLTDSRIAFADILLLVPDMAKTPPFDKEPNGVVKGAGQITGSVDDILVSKARFTMLDGTVLSADGRLRGLPDAEKLDMDLNINEISSTRADLLKMLPDSAVPASIELPEAVRISGKVKGSMENLTLATTINTSFGTGTFWGNLKNITDSLRAQYNGTLTLTEFDLGKLTKQPPTELGKLTLRTEVEGTGYAPKTMKARLDGNVASADIKGYVYQNLRLKGDVDHGLANISANMDDRNIDLDLNAQADLSKEYPSVKADLDVTNLNLTALNLYADSLQVKGSIKVDMPSTNPENPLGTVNVDSLVLTHHRRPIGISNINVQLTEAGDATKGVIEFVDMSEILHMNAVGCILDVT